MRNVTPAVRGTFARPVEFGDRDGRPAGRRTTVLAAAAFFAMWLHYFVPLSGEEPRRLTETLRGRVVFMAEAMERLHGVRSVREAAQRVLALETPDGQLIPLVEDIRGRAFRRDRQLRDLTDVELLVRRHVGSPSVQIIAVYSHENGRRLELDYWCEICAIAMFELKPCDCCQGPIQLRRRPAAKPSRP